MCLMFLEYLLSDKMNVHDLVLAAGGIKDSAYEVDAELTRMSMDTNQFTKIEHIRIQPSSFLETNASKEFRLLPYDRLNIKPAPLWNDGQFVTIEGEVNFPGVFVNAWPDGTVERGSGSEIQG